MKKGLLAILLFFITIVGFASSNSTNKSHGIPIVNQIGLYDDRSGSGTIVDNCGQTWDIEWTCTGVCDDETILDAITQWIQENTCGWNPFPF